MLGSCVRVMCMGHVLGLCAKGHELGSCVRVMF